MTVRNVALWFTMEISRIRDSLLVQAGVFYLLDILPANLSLSGHI